MFRDESGRLANVPSVDALRTAMKEPNSGMGDALAIGKIPMRSLMDQIGATVRGRLTEANLSQSENETRKYILKEFAKTGKPPAEQAIVEAMKLPSLESIRRFIERLHKADILTVEGGEIISAYPFSAKQTRHKVAFPDGHEIYALCATDALGIHFMLGENIVIRSRCPECEEEMKIEAKDGKIASCAPEGVVEFVSSGNHCGCTAKTFCPFMNFFCSKEHLEKWREKNPASSTGEMYQLQQVLEHGKYIFGDFLK
ncbi:MAG TPA: alkylmercury lyase family protein [Nitrospirota bacterium]|nr:alkylmercury lyase family protein [Nitrospirota bacterium]